MIRVHPAGRLAWQNFNVGHYPQTFQPDAFHTCHAYRQYWLLPLQATFADLALAKGSQSQRKAKPLGFILSHIFQLIMTFKTVLKQFKLSTPLLFFFFFFFCAFPLWGSPLLGEIFAYVTVFFCFFYPTIKVVTFRLRGWCVLGVFLLLAFTRLGHERQDLLSPCDEMHVCTD